MTKPNFTNTDATPAHNVANEAIDSQAGGAGEQAKETRSALNSTMSKVDASIRKQTSGGSGAP